MVLIATRLGYLLVLACLVGVIAGCGAEASQQMTGAGDQAYEGTRLSERAPDFTLTDQRGRTLSLSDLRGKIVVLTFLDSECHDICPITTHQLHEAYRQLGDKRQDVALLGVNVNAGAASVADVRAATRRWGVQGVRNWHFLTGSKARLSRVWRAYHETVARNPKDGDIIHSSDVYIIDRSGTERWYISVPSPEQGWKGPSLTELVKRHLEEML